jgi:hypothetical protein
MVTARSRPATLGSVGASVLRARDGFFFNVFMSQVWPAYRFVYSRRLR